MNALRLYQPIDIKLFETRTGLSFSVVEAQIKKAVSEGLMKMDEEYFFVTDKGHLFLNEVLEIFL